MFTKNWHKAAGAYITNAGSSVAITYTAMDGETVRTVVGNGYSVWCGYNMDDIKCPSMHKLRTSYTYGGVILGTGNTAPTIDDNTLSGDLVTGYNYSASITKAADENGVKITALYTITNTNSKAITIGEIGLMCCICESASGNQTDKALLERTALEVPITIEPGGVGQITYTIRVNYPTA